MNGITYYRLNSDYIGDYTKNCALNGTEVDNNFYVLESRDIKSIAVDGKDIIITLMNGNTVSAEGVLDFIKGEDLPNSIIGAEFDSINGVLTLTKSDGTLQIMEGFNLESKKTVSHDNTLIGDGTQAKPLGIAPAARTGKYKTVKAIIDTTKGEGLPECGNLIGDRYLTSEDISDYGLLYNYKAVKEIANALKDTEWRIPTKEDWDSLLNAIEPNDADKNHNSIDSNKFLGRWAGKFLKSRDFWMEYDGCSCDECCSKVVEEDSDSSDECNCTEVNPCIDTLESECNCKCNSTCKENYSGIDSFGLRIMPAGYADDGCVYAHLGERAAFWTATTDEENTKAYIKRFHYNRDEVYQDVVASGFRLSLRLVKDYDGMNFFGVEEILGMDYPTVLLPSTTKENLIWTTCNVTYENESLYGFLPNNGEELTYTRHYIINEWNGVKWVKNELRQGESVSVAFAPNGKQMVEYHVVGDDLVCDNELVYNEVITTIQPEIDDLRNALIEETNQRKEGDNQLNETISTVNNNLVTAINTINNAISAETAARIKGDEDEAKARRAADEGLQDAIDAEATARIAADKDLQDAIDAEAKAREDADEAEKNARIAADNDETEARKAADEVITGQLITSDGTNFNKDNGILTLKSVDGSNDVLVQFSFNFGEF